MIFFWLWYAHIHPTCPSRFCTKPVSSFFYITSYNQDSSHSWNTVSLLNFSFLLSFFCNLSLIYYRRNFCSPSFYLFSHNFALSYSLFFLFSVNFLQIYVSNVNILISSAEALLFLLSFSISIYHYIFQTLSFSFFFHHHNLKLFSFISFSSYLKLIFCCLLSIIAPEQFIMSIGSLKPRLF